MKFAVQVHVEKWARVYKMTICALTTPMLRNLRRVHKDEKRWSEIKVSYKRMCLPYVIKTYLKLNYSNRYNAVWLAYIQ
jgi:hypothetical protein